MNYKKNIHKKMKNMELGIVLWTKMCSHILDSYAAASLYTNNFRSCLDGGLCQGGHGGGGVDAGHRHPALPRIRSIPFAKIQTEH